jgi:hypothetical protein
MSTRVSWKCNKSEALIMIPSSYSSSSSGCSSCSVALSGSAAISCSAAISGMSMGFGIWLWCWCWCTSRHVGQTLIPLDAAEVWALSDRPVLWCAFDPFLSQNVSDEKRERQTPSLRVLSRLMVHSFPEFLN